MNRRNDVILLQTEDVRLKIRSLTPITLQDAHELHPLWQCQFRVCHRSAKEIRMLANKLDEEGFSFYRLEFIDDSDNYLNFPISELAYLYAPIFAKALDNLSAHRRWLCYIYGHKRLTSGKQVLPPYENYGVIWQKKEPATSLIVASQKYLEKVIIQAWKETLTESTFLRPSNGKFETVISRLSHTKTSRGIPSTTFARLTDILDFVATKDCDGYALSIMTKQDLDTFIHQSQIHTLMDYFRQSIHQRRTEFLQEITSANADILQVGDKVWSQSGKDEVLYRRLIGNIPLGQINEWKLLGVRIRNRGVLRLVYELRFERGKAWSMIEVDFPSGNVRKCWIDTIIMFASYK